MPYSAKLYCVFVNDSAILGQQPSFLIKRTKVGEGHVN